VRELSKRLAELPPEKRQLFEKLAGKGVAAPEAAHDPAPPPTGPQRPTVHAPPAGIGARTGSPGLSLTFGTSPDAVKEGYQRFYDGVTAQLDSTMFGDFSFFLNYGYVPNLNPQFSTVELPDHYINKNSIRLVLEVIGDCALSGRRVLDVGCGRGGTVYVLHQFFHPDSVTGLDLSPNAIAFCRRIHNYPGVDFREGDAEQLPFENASFDVVTNIESSHSYPNIRAFYSEVYRVLAPGGHFLYTDVLPVEQWEANVGLLKGLGFGVRRDTDITSNVLLSCDEVAKSRVQAFDSGNDPHLMRNFLATPESEVYTEMRNR
jgi:SAM-dependent methyltransferase